MSNETLQQIEQNIKRGKELIDFGAALERLQNNRDFKKVITEGYFRDEAVRLVHLKGDANMQTPEHQANIVRALDSIGQLSQYFSTVTLLASRAVLSIAADEETRDEILADGVTE